MLYITSLRRHLSSLFCSFVAALLLLTLLVACGNATPVAPTKKSQTTTLKPTQTAMTSKRIPLAGLNYPGPSEDYYIDDLAYSSDSKSIAFTMRSETTTAPDTTLKIWQIGTSSPISAQIGSDIEAFAWSPTSDLIAVATKDKGIVMVKGQDGSIATTMGDSSYGVRGITWSPDGHQIAASVGMVDAAAGDNVEVYDAQSGTAQMSLPIPKPSYSMQLAWSSDNKFIAAVTINPEYSLSGNVLNRGGILIWNIAKHQAIFQQNTGPTVSTRISFQPGTDLLAQVAKDATTHRTGILLIDAAAAHMVKLLAGSYRSPSWSPDGKYLIYHAPDTDEAQVLATSDWSMVDHYFTGPSMALAWSPDGRTVAIGGFGGDDNLTTWSAYTPPLQPTATPATSFTLVGTTWTGTFNESTDHTTFPLIAHFTKIENNDISLTLTWPTDKNTLVACSGSIVKDTNSGDIIDQQRWKYIEGDNTDHQGIWIKFREDNILSGDSNYELDGWYYAFIRDHKIMKGAYFLPNHTVPTANFQLSQ